jgi:S-DNA-T family DNA segregation ATPase FtsK/SpoIIIE
MPPNDEQKKIIVAIQLKLAQLGHEVMWQEPITIGPLISTYRFLPKASTKISQITSCADDLTLALACDEDVLVRRLPGEAVLGISVPNKTRKPVLWRDTLAPAEANIPLNMGTDSQGLLYRDDLATLPHLLVAGSTGSGKSIWMRAALASLIWWKSPAEIKFALSDTKGVEFPMFDGDPHQWQTRAQSKYTTWETLDNLYAETERRMKCFAFEQKRNIQEYNKTSPRIPYIIMFIDELATVLEGDKRGETKIAQSKLGRIVQLSRAAGVHIIAGTQRPSVDVVAGSIKNNFPARLSFRVSSGFDSRTVVNQDGAEHLISRGDMFYLSPNKAALARLHAAYADDSDLKQCIKISRERENINVSAN